MDISYYYYAFRRSYSEKNVSIPIYSIVGQDDMKMSLILNVINPSLGGVLIKGEKGTAKSTAVRALAELLPAMEAVHGCKFHCDPADPNLLCEDCASKYTEDNKLVADTVKMRVVELPVSATKIALLVLWILNMRLSMARKNLRQVF